MKLTLKRCMICEHWYRPASHSNHCPVCAAMPMMIAGKLFHVDTSNARTLIRGDWTWSNVGRHLVNVASRNNEA